MNAPERLFLVKLPERETQNAGVTMNAAQLVAQLVLTLPFWRAGRDLAKLDTQSALESMLDTPERVHQLRLTEQQREHLAAAMEAPTAMMQDRAINRLFSETLRAVLAAERAG